MNINSVKYDKMPSPKIVAGFILSFIEDLDKTQVEKNCKA